MCHILKVKETIKHLNFTLYLTDVVTKRNILDHVTVLRNGKEENEKRITSPSRVIRAIASQAMKFNVHCFVILTEAKFGKEQLFESVTWKASSGYAVACYSNI